jgi:hypothetical protein
MKQALVEFERNGYNDSDFFMVFFDSDKGSLGVQEIGSTRHAGGIDRSGFVKDLPAHELERARLDLQDRIQRALGLADQHDVLEPDNVAHGEVVRFLRDAGATSKFTYKQGDTGEVFYCSAFGTFYRNGYNHPGRNNRRVGLRLPDGTRVFSPLMYLRLHREPLTDDELRARATELSYHYQFGATAPGFTWASWENPQVVAARDIARHAENHLEAIAAQLTVPGLAPEVG